ncbi:hypothetical protein BKA67DRAFT_656549 [Truncatella angustata]|uniref:Rhodopsin domain-containing protein n=1 Tax=Truncatella angustata TaxID=152316 RepID=A0A9P9A0G6_9PEZI|nr:uncharacterized protein BKA67DRAFT_656549 [Truncatella angustata]KAH6658352.1 hypothetical protein BKA67DRAFT_656549 [Truncatella angustata]
MAFPIINGTEVMIPPPDGWVVNFTHPYRDESTKTHVLWAFGIEFPIATLFLIQRIYTSWFVLRKVRIDDYIIVVAWGFLVATQVMMLHLWRLGLVGLHGWEQSLDKSIYMTQIITALTLTAIVGTVLAKLTLCIFYYRLSPVRWYQYGILFTGFLCIACFGSVWFAVLFACRPVAAAWNLRLYTGDNCIARPPWYMLQAIAGGVTDLLLMVQPIPTVLRLHMSKKHKAALVAWFGIGIITLAAAVMRLVSLLSMIDSPDVPWTMADAMLWLVVESNLIVLCGCLPTFRVFLSHMFSTQKKNGTSGGGSGPSSGKVSKDSHVLRTFGQGKSRRFDSIAEIEHGDHRFRSDNYHVGVEAYGSGDAGPMADSGSEEVILQTRTATISYSK